jgi:hypothetical protein
MLSAYKTEAELRAFAEAAQKTLMTVQKKNKEKLKLYLKKINGSSNV